jgi:lipoprotein NlpD
MPSLPHSLRCVRAGSPWTKGFGAAVLVALLAACASRSPAPIEDRASRPAPVPPAAVATPAPKPVAEPDWRPRTYTVKRGDTLHAIALDHGLDYRELAAWNNIENLNLILVGQVLRLVPPGESTTVGAAGVTTMPLKSVPGVGSADGRPPASPSATPLAVPGPRNAENYKVQPKALKEPYSEQALRDMQRIAAVPPVVAPTQAVPAPTVATSSTSTTAMAPPAAASSGVAPSVATPAAAATASPSIRPEPKPMTGADEDEDERVEWVWPAKGKLVSGFSDGANLKGIDIAGAAGAPVVASAAGKVVYAGTGLRGYGKLVIVKHNGTYLTAYAHNRDILVKEGQSVTRGQKIAEMGNTDADQVKLHFEIRRHGKPVDPVKYLPPA